jgi:hypothetical protein
VSDDGTRDGAYGHADDFRGDIFEKFDLYWDRSPLKHVKNVRTLSLVLHSDNDFRVPIEQGEQRLLRCQPLCAIGCSHNERQIRHDSRRSPLGIMKDIEVEAPPSRNDPAGALDVVPFTPFRKSERSV